LWRDFGSHEVVDKRLRILIADDQPNMRRAVRALLESKTGWEICGEASDGQEAIDRTGELQPDVVIMDVFMPKLNGIEATRQIHRSFPHSQVLILTFHDLPALARAAHDAGARGCVFKGDSSRFLIPAVEGLNDSSTAFYSKHPNLGF
jgi:DNA-binding NarL/FixJ family response regulator